MCGVGGALSFLSFPITLPDAPTGANNESGRGIACLFEPHHPRDARCTQLGTNRETGASEHSHTPMSHFYQRRMRCPFFSNQAKVLLTGPGTPTKLQQQPSIVHWHFPRLSPSRINCSARYTNQGPSCESGDPALVSFAVLSTRCSVQVGTTKGQLHSHTPKTHFCQCRVTAPSHFSFVRSSFFRSSLPHQVDESGLKPQQVLSAELESRLRPGGY